MWLSARSGACEGIGNEIHVNSSQLHGKWGVSVMYWIIHEGKLLTGSSLHYGVDSLLRMGTLWMLCLLHDLNLIWQTAVHILSKYLIWKTAVPFMSKYSKAKDIPHLSFYLIWQVSPARPGSLGSFRFARNKTWKYVLIVLMWHSCARNLGKTIKWCSCDISVPEISERWRSDDQIMI